MTAVLALVAALRIVPQLAHDWPLGDGGLFYSMVGDIIREGFALPDVTSYQGGVIPYAYPPLAFFAAAIVEALTDVARSDILRSMATGAAVLAIAAMYLVASEIGPSRRHALVSAAYFGAMMGLSIHLVAGGGLTRAPGLLLALLATWQGLRLQQRGTWRHAISTAVLAGLAVLTHPESGPFIGVALGASLITRFSRQALLQTIAAGLGALLVASPWIVTVLARHGIEPLLGAIGVVRRDPFDAVIAYGFLFLLTAPLVGILDIIGQIREIKRRRPHLLVWRIGVFALDLRYSPIAGAVPVSLLAAHGTLDVAAPLTWRLLRRLDPRRPGRSGSRAWRLVVVSTSVVLAFVPTVAASLDSATSGAALTREQRAAMTWVRDHTPESTEVAILATHLWGSDLVSEWLPALAERKGLTAVQGFEWAPEARAGALKAEEELRSCQGLRGDARVGCVDSWFRGHADPETGLLLITACCGDLATELVAGGDYRMVWQAEGVTILALAPGAAA